MNNLVLSTRNIDDFVSDIANEVIKKVEMWNKKPLFPQPETEELLTVQQTAKFLSLSVATVYGLISKGELPVMKRSKRCYFSRQELMNYLRQGRKKTVTETVDEADAYCLTKKKNGKL